MSKPIYTMGTRKIKSPSKTNVESRQTTYDLEELRISRMRASRKNLQTERTAMHLGTTQEKSVYKFDSILLL